MDVLRHSFEVVAQEDPSQQKQDGNVEEGLPGDSKSREPRRASGEDQKTDAKELERDPERDAVIRMDSPSLPLPQNQARGEQRRRDA